MVYSCGKDRGKQIMKQMGVWGMPSTNREKVTSWNWGNHQVMLGGGTYMSQLWGYHRGARKGSSINRNCPLPTTLINGEEYAYPWGRWFGGILRIRVAGARTKQKQDFNHEGRHMGDTWPEDRKNAN